MDSFFDGKAAPGRGKDKKKDAKKEDRAAFLARTQAQRESRQHTRQENHAATKMQAMLRRSKDLTAARQILLARLANCIQADPATTWQHTSMLVRLVCLARAGGPTRAELLQAVKALLSSLTSDSGEDSYTRKGLREHAGVLQLQLKRICGYVVAEMVRCQWTLQPSERLEEDAALLKAVFVLTDNAQWKASAGIPAAAKVCSELVGSLVVEQQQRSHGRARCTGLYESLRRVLCPTDEFKGAKGTAQAPLLWTLAIRPLTAGFAAGDPRQVWVAYRFAREILSIPAVFSEIPEVLRQAVLHQSVWPRVVFSLGTAAQIHPPTFEPPPLSQSSLSSTSTTALCSGGWLPDDRVLDVMCNLVELTHKTPIAGLQLLYLSALQRLVEMLPSGALSLPANTAKVKLLAPLQSPQHVQWLLCGLGGDANPTSDAAAAHPSNRPGNSGGRGPLKTQKYAEWTCVYREVRAKRNTAGKPQFTEGVTYLCSVSGSCCARGPLGIFKC